MGKGVDPRDIAKKMATMKGKAAKPIASEQKRLSLESDLGLTTYNDMIGDFRIDVVETSTGKKFLIQSLDPGTIFVLYGSPLIGIAEGTLDLSDLSDHPEKIKETLDAIPDSKKMEMVSNPDFMKMVKLTVCDGVTSMNFVMKNQIDCNPDEKEVSVDRIKVDELFELYNAIMTLSFSNDEEASHLFRFESEEQRPEDPGGDGENSPDSTGIQSETESTVISMEAES